jgi:hypothetical protein
VPDFAAQALQTRGACRFGRNAVLSPQQRAQVMKPHEAHTPPDPSAISLLQT